jgi:hypothetical protein
LTDITVSGSGNLVVGNMYGGSIEQITIYVQGVAAHEGGEAAWTAA